MTCPDVSARLSEYLDHTLDAHERAAVATHLGTCATCRGLLDDLDRIHHAARALGPITPPAHLWMEIAGRIRLEGGAQAVTTPARSTAFTRSPRATPADAWQWVGLAAGLVLVTAAVYFIAAPDTTATTPVSITSNADEPATVETVEDTLRRAEAEYERAIVMLEEIIRKDDPSVNATTLATLQKNVTAIDSAIAESRAALTDNPASQPARTSLFEALANKVNLLQSTVVLMNEMRKGDAGGAADAAAGLDRKTS